MVRQFPSPAPVTKLRQVQVSGVGFDVTIGTQGPSVVVAVAFVIVHPIRENILVVFQVYLSIF